MGYTTLFFLTFLSLTYSFSSQADYRAEFVPPTASQIPGLTWQVEESNRSPEVTAKDPKHPEAGAKVSLKGTFDHPGGTLLFGDQEVSLDEDRQFTLQVEVNSERSPFVLVAVDEKGDIYKEPAQVQFKEWKKFEKEFKPSSAPSAPVAPAASQNAPPVASPATLKAQSTKAKRFSVTGALGVTRLTYKQTDLPSFNEFLLSPKGAVKYQWAKNWSVDVNLYGNAVALKKSSQYGILFFGANAKVGYRVPYLQGKHFSFVFSGGYYFNTSFANDATFGYKNVNGPQLYPMLTYNFANRKFLWLYVKYSPIFNGLALLSLNNTEIAMGVGYSFKTFSNGSALAASADIVRLKIQLIGITVQADTMTIGASFRY